MRVKENFDKMAKIMNKASKEVDVLLKECDCDNCEIEKHWTPLDKNMLNNLEEKEWDLSSQIYDDLKPELDVDDVKEFIRRLKGKLNKRFQYAKVDMSAMKHLKTISKEQIIKNKLIEDILGYVDKLAGEELI